MYTMSVFGTKRKTRHCSTYAKRVRLEGTDVGKIFESHRPIIERVASDAYDAGRLDEEGRVLVTVDAPEQASRSA